MCGIAGLVYREPSRPCEAGVITAMRDVASYRGPDDAGNYISGPVGLGHRRLSIIDLGGGHQPMTDQREASWIVYNGEVYNYRPLRDSLMAKGYVFRTHSDTEVILKLYAEMGERCVEHLNGMFAFAIWDAKHQCLFLARDRMGVKPLYYAETPDAFVFGSEIKCLFASGQITPCLREEAVAEYLIFRQVAGSDGLFKGVKSLAPGCSMTVRNGHVRISRYWSPLPPADRGAMDYATALQSLADLIDDSVRLRLISDVPVGTFCSGGVDSSLITAVAARQLGRDVNSYSVGFDEPNFDESPYAEAVAAHCGTTHHQLRLGNAGFSDLLPRMIWHNDEPLDFANSIHIFALSELARARVKVVLTGEGSDELFGGYPRYRLPGLARSYRYVPTRIRRTITTISRDHRLAKLDRFAGVSPDDSLLYNASYLRADVVAAAAPTLCSPCLRSRRASLQQTSELGLDAVGRLSLLDQDTFLVGILHRQDKMSMAASIESRVPFMDYRIVEFANRLPSAFKIKGGQGKPLVKDLARRYLPSKIVDRRKSGFGVPLSRWFRSSEGLGERICALPDSSASDVFDRALMRRMIDDHRSGEADHSELLWTALNLVTWREVFHC